MPDQFALPRPLPDAPGPVALCDHRPDAPLTPIQAGMIYETALAGRPGLNLEQIVVRMPGGSAQAEAMRAAWQAVALRHPALRMAVDLSAAEPVQIVQPQPEVRLQSLDLRDAPDRDSALAQFLAADRDKGADATAWPNWRLTLLELGDQQALVWTFPHSLLDGRSFATVLEEAFERHDALLAGSAPARREEAPDPAPHYRALAADCSGSAQRFCSHLEGFETANEVGLGLLPQPDPAGGKPVLESWLNAEDARRLTARAARAGGTLATALNAAWGMVIARTSGQRQAVFGVTRSGRHLLPQSPRMVGCLINTVPLCVRMGRETTLDGLLRQVRSDQLALRPHEHCPLTAIRTALSLPGDRPLFHTMVVYDRQSLHDRMQMLGGAWTGRRVDLHEEGALPLTLAAYGEDRLLLRLEHDPSTIAPEAAARYLDYLTRLLRAMAAAEGDPPLSAVSMLPDQESTDLARWSQGAPRQTIPPSCVALAFAEVARRHPHATALITPEGAMVSFAELDRKTDNLARLFAAEGAGPGRIVALCLPRSADYVAALLAVLRTGAAFLPLDPAYPAETLGFMARDSGAAFLVARRVAPWMTGHRVVDPDQPLRAVPLPALAADPARTAYVIYTSGTTGRPKGVMVPQSALAAHSAAARDWLRLGPEDRVLQFTSLGFDVSIEEIVPTLLAAATLVLRPEAAARDPRLLLETVRTQGVTVLNLPTGFWQALLDDMELSGVSLPPTVRLVVAGGERVPAAALRRWRRIAPDIDWANGYGPTEATITSAAHALPAGLPAPEGEVPVGQPLAHARLHVLAPDGSASPPGCTGGLWIGGDCVAGGYLNLPALSAQKFVALPGLGRAYDSGDLARWSPEGILMLGGRNDRQIKLRGFRIEPAEVERVLEGLEDVGQALVAVLDAGTPAARLVGWVRPSVAGEVLDAGALEAEAAALLPPQMRPRIVAVADWPMRPGGKVDMAALPRPDLRQPAGSDADAGDAATQRIVALFRDLLNTPTVRADSGFFELGGHSLLLIRLIGRIEASFGRRLSVADVHAAPTPRAIARLLAEGGGGRSLDDCIVAIQRQGDLPPIYGVHVLGVNGNYYRPLSRAMGPDQPIYGLTVGLLDEFTPTGVAETAELYQRVLDRHQPQGPLALVAVSLGSYVALELAQRLLAAGREVTMLAILDAEGPGGRPRISRPARARAHLTRLRREPARYMLSQTGHKLNEFRHWLEKLRLVLSGRMGRPRAPATSVEGFVAANELAVQAYRPKPYPLRMTVVRATDSIFDSDEAIATGLGWAPVAAGGFDLVEVPGDHLTIMEDPAVQYLARALRDALDPAGKT
ncbi:MAG: amino acid adenylation domain-containing protein [Paracoccaceae bacterium]